MEVRLLPVQKRLLDSSAPFAGIYGGRGLGKSFILSVMAVRNLFEGRSSMIWGQNFRTLKDVLFDNIKARLSEWGLFPLVSVNMSDMTISYGNRKIVGMSYENLDACRGYSDISMQLYDEIATASRELRAVAAPCMRGPGIVPAERFASTPRMGSYWDQFFRSERGKSVEVITGNFYGNVFLTDEQRASIEGAILDPRLRAQEIYGEILEASDDTQVIRLGEFPERPGELSDGRIYVGIDCAGSGVDRTAIAVRRGTKILGVFSDPDADSYGVKAKLRAMLSGERPEAVFVDMAYGQGVYDQLKYEYPRVELVQFASAARNPERFQNKRCEMYFDLCDAIRGGLFVESPEIRRDLCATHFFVNARNRLQLESKDAIKAVVGHSPDLADALALSFSDGYDPEEGTAFSPVRDAVSERRRRRALRMMGA